MRNKKIKTFYTPKQVCFDSIKEKSYSQSPLKPALLIDKINNSEYSDMLEITDFIFILKNSELHTTTDKKYQCNRRDSSGEKSDKQKVA